MLDINVERFSVLYAGVTDWMTAKYACGAARTRRVAGPFVYLYVHCCSVFTAR